MHQCSFARQWTPEEEKLLQEIGRRLEDALTGLLSFRNLQESEERYRMVFENSPVSIWEEDFSGVKTILEELRKKGVDDIESYLKEHPEVVQKCAEQVRVLDVNRASLTLHSATDKDELLAGLVNTFTPESFDTFREELVSIWKGITEMKRDAVVKTLEGDVRNVTVYFSVCPGCEEDLSRVIVSLVDITDRKNTEEALQKSESLLSVSQHLAGIGGWEYDVKTGASFWTEELYRIHEIPEDTGIDHVRESVNCYDEKDRPVIEAAFQRACENGVSYDLEFPFTTYKGNRLWVRTAAQPIYEGDSVVRVVGNLMDITERREKDDVLKNTSKRLIEAQRLARIGSWELDLTDNELSWTDEIFRIFEIDPEKFGATYEAFLDTVHPDDREAVDFAYTNSLKTKQPYSISHRLLFPDGRIKYVYEQCETYYEGDRPVRSIGTVQDVTEQKIIEKERMDNLHFLESMSRINRAIQRSGDLEQLMTDALDEMLSIFDCDRAWFVYPCDPDAPSWQVPMERTRPEYPGAGAGILGVDIPMDESVSESHRRQLAARGPLKHGPGTDNPLSPEDSERFGYKSFISLAIYPKIGKPWMFGMHQCSYPRQWTAREEWLFQEIGNRMEDSLTSLLSSRNVKESEERYRIVADNTYDWEFWMGPRGEFLYNSLSCQRITGHSADEFEKDPGVILEIIHPDDRESYSAHIDEAARNRKPMEIIFRIIHSDGTVKWVEQICQSLYNEDGGYIGIRGSNRDITDRKRIDEELALYRDHLEELVKERTVELETANRELEAFAYSISHDLRAPLRHISGFVSLLEKEAGADVSRKGHYYMNLISEAAGKMGQLIDDLLAFSRMGRQSMSIEKTGLEDIVYDIIRDQKSDITGRNLVWHTDKLPVVHCDVAMLRIVLNNLISNAVKFTRPREEAVIEIGSCSEKDEVVIFVRDNGVGFDPKYTDKIFGVFHRLHLSEEFEGTGVGLAIAQRIVLRHGGRIWAEGEPDKGATFYFSLPIDEGGGE
jgi:PAS domain S-box-containing protein